MVKSIFKIGISLVFFVFLLNFVNATSFFGVMNHSIQSVYGLGDDIRGWINISFDDEPSTSILKSSFGDSIPILNLLKKKSNSAFRYSCVPSDCNFSYNANNKELSKQYSTQEDSEEVFFGLYVEKDKALESVSEFSMKLNLTNPELKEPPISIDFFADGVTDWVSSEGTGKFAVEKYGCFVEEDSTELAQFSDKTYCEKIMLLPSPGVQIGAIVNGTGEALFTLSIEEEEGSNRGECEAESRGEERVFCVPEDFEINEKGKYFVCIKANNEVAKSYKIKYEEVSPCGFTGEEMEYYYDFNIFASEETYSNVGSIVLNKTSLKILTGVDIETSIEDYISKEYDNNCSEGCVIPIKFTLAPESELSLTDLTFSYTTLGLGFPPDTFIYDILEYAPKINSNFSKLFLDDAGFSTPQKQGNYSFQLLFNNKKIFTEKIVIESDSAIRLKSSAFLPKGYPSKIEVQVSNTTPIKNYEWDFGDNYTEKTTTPEVSHTYQKQGTYTLTVTVTDLNNKASSKSFSLSVVLASAIVPSLLVEKNDSLRELKLSIDNSSKFSDFEKKSIYSLLKINQMQETINNISKSITTSSPEGEYNKFLSNLSEMDIADSVLTLLSGTNIGLYPNNDFIVPSVMREIQDLENYSSSQDLAYREAITNWWNDNKNVTFSFKEVSLIKGSETYPLVKSFILNIHPLKSDSNQSYLVFEKLDNLFFEDNSSIIEKDLYLFIPLDNSDKVIVFSTTENIVFSSLPVFISPTLANLNPQNLTEEPTRFISFKRPFFITASIIVIFIGLILWILIGKWYNRKYEARLFKDKNQLYNLVNFIEKERELKKKDSEITQSLRKVGWSSEQLRYAMRKHSNKPTGMPGIKK